MEQIKMEQKKGTWGGRRPNAGRKATYLEKTVTITLRVASSVKEELRRRATSEGKAIGKIIEEMLAARRAGV